MEALEKLRLISFFSTRRISYDYGYDQLLSIHAAKKKHGLLKTRAQGPQMTDS